MPFDRAKSQISENKKVAFLKAPWDSPLVDVPGIGPATAKALKEKGITTLYQLAGVFLTFKAADVDEDEWCNRMWEYLTQIGCPGGHKAGVIDCLGEKLSLAFPAIYTPQ
eukprot:CAMPEP_0195524238 /NCGR_PEP_ID=MMETSP0794_2-20130614/23959_1 /TAXON_ID=515487 /ORGANISM="Stephanopyxis turris, Strain CCMP 815" /LENGTH=109 /DNA_ID=CAMNT_0040654415 /DNA_START=63 /DNA_END=392 /DNA_ORIENTATION=-